MTDILYSICTINLAISHKSFFFFLIIQPINQPINQSINNNQQQSTINQIDTPYVMQFILLPLSIYLPPYIYIFGFPLSISLSRERERKKEREKKEREREKENERKSERKTGEKKAPRGVERGGNGSFSMF